MNKVVLIGRLTRDLEIKKTPNGASVLNFSLAVNRNFKAQAGQPEADFINCVAWNQTADLMSQYLGKGSLVGIEGRIQTRNYDDNNGRRVYVTEVVAERVEFLESRSQRQNTAQSGYYEQEAPAYQADSFASSSVQDDFDDEPILDIASDDLPF